MEEAERFAASVARDALAKMCACEPDLEVASGGLSNHVFRARTPKGDLIVRVADAAKLATFQREHQVTTRVRQAGVPAPEVLAVEEAGEHVVMIAHALPGEIARDHPHRLRTLKALGALAAKQIHTIPTSGAGCDFTFPPERVASNWADWLLHELDSEVRLERLKDYGLTSEAQDSDFRRTLEDVVNWTAATILNHGDLRLKNILVDDEGGIVGVIDWEESVSAPGPHWDLSVALHDLGVDGVQALLEGYGLTAEEIAAASPSWRLFNALNYAPEVERAIGEGDAEALDRFRVRFSGALHLFGSF